MSRLSDDFNMYFNGTYIGYKPPGQDQIFPFMIEDVRSASEDSFEEYDSDEWDDDYDDYLAARDNFYDNLESSDDYSPEAYDSLVFSGYYLTDEMGGSRHIDVEGYENPTLVFKNPLLGYFKTSRISQRKTWYTYVSTRSVKKGLAGNRVNGGLNNYVVYHIFKDYDKDRLERDFHLEQNTHYIKYRYNAIVAMKDPNVDIIYVDPLALHLIGDITRAFPSCQIIEQEL